MGESPVQWLENQTHDLKAVGFKSCLIHNTRWKWSTFKAMPESIPAPNSGSFVEMKIQVAKWGKPQIYIE